MAARLLKFLLHRLQSVSQKRQTDGFTLIEILMSLAIASIVVSSLLYMIVQLLETNQRESAQTETQQEIQIALDFMSSELRQAVYVYGGNCLQGQGTITGGVPSADYCPGIVNHIPNFSINTLPILAFWKLDPLPDAVKSDCDNNTAAATVPCISGRTYTLVVYFLRRNLSSDSTQWSGKARITRYELNQYTSDGTATANYVTPEQTGVNFRTWPYKNSGGTLNNLQADKPNGDADTLIDFVDDIARAGDGSVRCPTNYEPTPNTTTLSINNAFTSVRSFYACVKGGTGEDAGFNQDVFVFIRGNATGKPGLNSDKFLPTLQTQVLLRGIVNKTPSLLQ